MQAIFLGPNIPHAYLAGDCVEIMATSDNVVCVCARARACVRARVLVKGFFLSN